MEMHTPLTNAVLGAVVALGAGCASPDRPGQKSDEDRIWALEQAYFEYNRDADYERIAATWHDQFLGWPDAEDEPIDKEEGTRYIRRVFQKPGSFDFEIERKGIRILGDVAVNYYTVHSTTRDDRGQEQKRHMRIIHAWLKEGGQWRVLGGMSKTVQ